MTVIGTENMAGGMGATIIRAAHFPTATAIANSVKGEAGGEGGAGQAAVMDMKRMAAGKIAGGAMNSPMCRRRRFRLPPIPGARREHGGGVLPPGPRRKAGRGRQAAG